jgi:hypothetical protein
MRRAKRLLLLSAAGAVAAATFLAPYAQADHKTVVSINGLVGGVGGDLRVQAQADGPANALVGQGSDRTTPTGGDPFYCRFPLSGSVIGNSVSLAGAVEFSNNPEPPGAWTGTPVTVSGTDTGPGPNDPITFTFGPFSFSGFGSVVIAHS